MPRRHLWKVEIGREIERIQSEQPEIFYSEEYTVPRAKKRFNIHVSGAN